MAGFGLILLLVGFGGWLLCVTMLGHYLGEGYPLYPSLKVSRTSLVVDMLPVAILFGLAAAVLGVVIASRKWRYLTFAVLFTIGLYIAGETAAFMVQIDGGATWGPGEAFHAFIWHPVIYPAINLGGIFVLWLIYKIR